MKGSFTCESKSNRPRALDEFQTQRKVSTPSVHDRLQRRRYLLLDVHAGVGERDGAHNCRKDDLELEDRCVGMGIAFNPEKLK